jgi:hypothetical protein
VKLKTEPASMRTFTIFSQEWRHLHERRMPFGSIRRNSTGLFRHLFRSFVRHLKELQTCAHDQPAAMAELREAIRRLQQELKRSIAARPLAMETAQQQ